jgi:hypothetical protein
VWVERFWTTHYLQAHECELQLALEVGPEGPIAEVEACPTSPPRKTWVMAAPFVPMVNDKELRAAEEARRLAAEVLGMEERARLQGTEKAIAQLATEKMEEVATKHREAVEAEKRRKAEREEAMKQAEKLAQIRRAQMCHLGGRVR